MDTNSKLIRLFFVVVAPMLAGVNKPVRRVAAVYHLLLLPIHFATRKVKHHRKRVVKLSLGATIAAVGVLMASHPWEVVPHLLWDGVAYGLHGYGALPFVKLGCKFLDLEDIS
jgi:hypothetical protein